jgi:hypothetical protein
MIKNTNKVSSIRKDGQLPDGAKKDDRHKHNQKKQQNKEDHFSDVSSQPQQVVVPTHRARVDFAV